MKKKFIVVIPARLKSTRLPNKPLKLINKKPLIYWTWKNCAKVIQKDLIYVATDSPKIHNICKKYNIQSINTGSNHLTGTDRIAEASLKINSQMIINLQGDEPFIRPSDIKSFINFALKNKKVITNAYAIINKNIKKSNTNVPKCVVSIDNFLLYMSRSPIPGSKIKNYKIKSFKQVCMYGFPKTILKKLYGLNKKKTKLESIEDIELLRVIENGYKVKMLKVNDNKIAIDTPLDLIAARKLIK